MRMKGRAICLFVRLAILFCAFPVAAQEVDVAVVVNENNRVDNLTSAELRKIFFGERRSWAVGIPIKLIVRGSATHERAVLLKLLAMSESEYKEYWIAQIFRGEADAEPLTLPSFDLEKQAVSIFPGAIAFVDAQELKPGMKVLKLNGRMPGESGYPLH